MTTAGSSTAAHATRTPLVRRNLTRERADAFELVEWCERSVQLAEPDGRLRQIGIGHGNVAALLLTLGIPYDSDGGRGWAAAMTALMTGVAYRRSAELADALGAFEEFERNREPMLKVIERHIEALDRLESELPAGVLAAARREWTRALELEPLALARQQHPARAEQLTADIRERWATPAGHLSRERRPDAQHNPGRRRID
jgi:Ribonucleotide reductase, barrel domain